MRMELEALKADIQRKFIEQNTARLNVSAAREKQEDYPGITSKIITTHIENSKIISLEDAKELSKYDNTVFVFMSPNDISKLENELKEILNS